MAPTHRRAPRLAAALDRLGYLTDRDIGARALEHGIDCGRSQVEMLRGLFEGVRILSLAELYPGPFAGMLFADLGADVILVERPTGGDPARAYPAFFASMARNKRSVCINLKTPEGLAAFNGLIPGVDVVLEGFRPGTMARLGVGYDDLRKINPRLIFASISGFGQTGPYRNRTAHDLSYQAVSGHMYQQASDLSAATPHIAYGDLSGAMFTAFSVASALFARERTGMGTAIDVSISDSLVSWMTAHLAPIMNRQATPSLHDEPAYGVFAAADGALLTLSISHEDYFWRALCRALEMDADASLKANDRIARSGELRARIADVLLRHPVGHWAQLFDANAIPWSPQYTLEQVAADPHFVSRRLFGTLGREDGSTEFHVQQPVKFSAYSSGVRRPAPGLGEHGPHILDSSRE
jgi:crotonobetainyl-CoA:carnitine CoA-transferase CaiB-like acyl-CoA transferase